MPRPSTLKIHPQALILALLRKSKVPVSAYGLLEKLQSKGIKSAPIIYRALAALEKQGAVHKIQAIGAYVACNCASDHTHPLSVLTVCGGCRAVQELHDHVVIDHLAKLRRMKVNLATQAVIELPVTCAQCAA